MTRHGYVQYISARDPYLEERLEAVEARMVGELATKVHKAGERFEDWPVIERAWVGRRHNGEELELPAPLHFAADHVRLWATVVGVPR